jgi:protein-S-isoprenylcysteine O-methyltransferase Ste14
MWCGHYAYRALVYPAVRRGGHKPMPLSVIAMGAVFNVGNAYLNGRALFTLGPFRSDEWLADPRFLAGTALFVAGFVTHVHSDRVLAQLRAGASDGYAVPRRGLHRWVASPNYLGETVQWIGFAIATWSLPALAFAVWTVANLAPRARSHLAWYRANFPDYPEHRRAMLPFVF